MQIGTLRSNACQLHYFTAHTISQNNGSTTLLHACHLPIIDTYTCFELSSNLVSAKTRKQLKALTVFAEKASVTNTISLVAVMLIISSQRAIPSSDNIEPLTFQPGNWTRYLPGVVPAGYQQTTSNWSP